MYLVLFTYVFGGALAGSTHKYLQQSLPGILVLSVVFATLGTGMMLSQDISTGVFDRFRALPIVRWAPLAGAILGDLIRYLISILVTLGFGYVLGFRVQTTVVATVMGCLVLLAFAFAMCWLSAMLGVLVKSAQGVQLWGFLFMFPLVFGSNILTPTRSMPGWLAGLRQGQPRHLPHRGGTRAAHRRPPPPPPWNAPCCGRSASSWSSPRSPLPPTAAARRDPCLASPGEPRQRRLARRRRPTGLSRRHPSHH
jgi:ABC transporter DrrB family efflux protein